jgi:hypothetical protein
MFFNGWAIAIGSVAVALPVIIHWLTRPRPTRVHVSTLRFIRGAVEQRRRRHRLRDILILASRCLAVALLAAAIARPLWNQRRVAASDSSAALTRIVLLDCSQSMSARDGGIARFERARPIVADLMKFKPSMKCGLLLAGANPEPVLDEVTTNFGVLLDALSDSDPRPERLRVQPALSSVASMFGKADSGSAMELIIVSDFQRTNWASADFSVLPQNCRIELRSAARDTNSENLGLLEFAPVGRVEVGRDAEVTVKVGNYSDTPRSVRAEVRLGDIVLPFEEHCPARAVTTMTGRIPITDSGWLFGSARINDAGDSLPDDDTLPVGIYAHPRPRLVIVTRDRPDRIPSSSYYVERALNAVFGSSRSARTGRGDRETGNAATGRHVGVERDSLVTRIDAADPDVELLRQADVVVLARAGRLSREMISVLVALLQRGRGLLYFAGDQLDAASLQDLVSAAGSSLRLPVDFSPRPPDRARVTRYLTTADRRRPPFSVFGDELSTAMKSVELNGGLVSRVIPDGLQDDIRGVLNDQSAFITVSSAGRGRVAVVNADLESSNIAKTSALVPLLAELLSQELTSQNSGSNTFACGEPFTAQLPVGEERIADLKLIGPDERELPEASRGALAGVPGGVLWDMTQAATTGAYRAVLEGQTIGAGVAVVPAEESDLRGLPEEVFADRLVGGRDLLFLEQSAASADRQDDLWVWLAATCVGFQLIELLLLRFFRT